MPNYPKDLHASFVGDYSDYEIPPDVALDACIRGVDFEEQGCKDGDCAAYVDFELPIVGTLFFLSRGHNCFGAIKATSSPNQPPGVANIKITAKYVLEEVRNQIRILLLDRGEDSKGFGVFTPRWHARPFNYGSPSTTLHFDVTITFPEGTEDHPFKIPNFHSDAPGMSHGFNQLTKIAFADISLSSINHPILIKFLRAERGVIETVNAPIRGQFESTGDIQLSTVNAPIIIDVTLHSGESDASLTTRTSNANINACIRAFGKPGPFDIRAKTSNGSVTVDFEEAPASSVVRLGAVTSNGSAMISLPPTFEGKFLAKTTPFDCAIVKSVGGKEVHLQTTKSRTEGRVGCNRGIVDVKTTNASATINLR